MAEASTSAPAPKRRLRWLRILGWIFVTLIILLVVAYFVGTSSAFFKGVILPKVGQSMNAEVTVSDASISPFREVVLHNLKVQPNGQEPLLTAAEVRLRYSLLDIIGGKMNVDLVSVSSPVISLIENPDGSSNLDPILKAQKPSEKEQPKEKVPSQPSKPMQVDLKKMAISEATLRRVKIHPGGSRDSAEISHANLELTNVKNAQAGQLAISADFKADNNPPAPGTNAMLQGRVDGKFSFALTADLKPASVVGNTRLQVAQAAGAFAQLGGFAANLETDVTPAEIKQVALRFQKGETRLGELLVSGPFQMEKNEGRLSIQVLNIDKNLLNLAGAGAGLDFGATTISSSNVLELAKSGSVITAAGNLNLSNLTVTRTNQTTPRMDLRAQYDLTINQASSNVIVRALTLDGTQKENRFLRAELSQPMTIPLGKSSSPMSDSTFNLAVTRLNLADWKPFLGTIAPAGEVNATVKVVSQAAANQISFDANSAIQSLAVMAGTNLMTDLGVALRARGQATNKSTNVTEVKIPEFSLELEHSRQPVANLAGNVAYNTGTEAADVDVSGQLLLPALLQCLPPNTNVVLSSGRTDLKLHVAQKDKKQNVTGTVNLADLSGTIGSMALRAFGAGLDMDLGMTTNQVEIRKFSGKLSQANKPGGAFDVTGTVELPSNTTRIQARLSGFNQDGLGPFLQAALQDKKLVSVALNGNADVRYLPAGTSTIKGGLQMTNLVVNDPRNQIPATPLDVAFQFDTGITSNKLVDIRQVQFALTPLDQNKVQLTGKLDLTDANATQGNLKISADTLDVTRFYDLFAGQKPVTTASAQPAQAPLPAATSPAPPATAPATNSLPLRDFTAEINVKRFLVHEVEISNFQAVAKIDRTKVLLKPFQLALNNAPISSTIDLDLGVPGYQYAVGFSAVQVPLAPIVNTFQPERRGQVGGTFTAQADISGTGTDGAALKKSLAGKFDIGSTNLNLSVVNIRSPLLRSLINVVSLIPELIKNPESAAGSLVAGLFGSKSSGGLANELSKSPIDSIVLRGSAGSGVVDLQQAIVQSPAFRAEAKGAITLQNVISNSQVNIPVSVSLSRKISENLNIVPPNTATNVAFIQLPQFVTMKGTVGDPKPDINKLALAGFAMKSIGGLIPGDNKTGGVLQNLGSFLGGNTSAAGGTNAPAHTPTNKPGVGGLLQGLLGTPASATNAPTGPTPPATNQSPIGNLFNQLLGPKKK